MKNEIIPEWQVDNTGRRFRMVGKTKEYEMEVSTSFGTIPESQLRETVKRMKNERQKELEELKNRPSQAYLFCPIKALKGACNVSCERENCALYTGKSCGLMGKTPRETKGKKCPYSMQSCRDDCALYCNGCTVQR